MKSLKIIGLLALTFVVLNACKKKDPVEVEYKEPGKRDEITYQMSVFTRAENRLGDTLIVKVNGSVVYSYKGSVPGDIYGASPLGPKKVKTGDVISVRYYPGKVTLTQGNTILDENGLLLTLDYDINNSKILKEFNCRCVADFETTLE